MTDPTPRRTTRSTTDGAARGDRPRRESAEAQQEPPVRRRDTLSPLVIAGIVAFVALVTLIVLLVT